MRTRPLVVLILCGMATLASAGGAKLQVMGSDYPRVFFFRQCEGMAAQTRVPYAQWERTFERLMGIEGKVLEEEVPGRSIRNIDFFTRFKKRHPEQLVLLHFNGNARDPRFESHRFFAGHWIYFDGARILADVPAEEGVTEIRVSDPGLFRVNMGRYRTSNEDIGLCVLGGDGKPDWRRSEQVQLVSVDTNKRVIRVRRGCYGTQPQAFSANQAYAAAHATEGPWGRQSSLLWFYNYSTRCPHDEKGRVCADVLVDHLGELFASDGSLGAFDGLEFDVLHHACRGSGKRRPDCDADGQADGGVLDGINTYGVGVVEFCRKLRERLGDDLLVLADGHSVNGQRAFDLLNGIESEGWPYLRDPQITDWSGGLNRHLFWQANGRKPVFSYINHKFNEPTDRPGVVEAPDLPFSTHRLVFAAAVFTDAASCYSLPPANDPEGMFGVWDEFRMGQENKLGWLGKPLGPAVHLAMGKPDVLDTIDLLDRLGGERVTCVRDGAGVILRATEPATDEMRFRLHGVPCEGPDVFISLTARAASRKHYPKEMARLLYVGLKPQAKQSTQAMTWCNERDFTSTFYFPDVQSGSIDLEFTIEGGEPVWISNVKVRCHPDAMVREFENGVVVANPSPRPYTFELDRLFPGRGFRRLWATANQDQDTNDGQPVEEPLTLGPKDALFLVAR